MPPSLLRAALVTVGCVALAFALRAWPLGGTGTRFAWLTFYPAVMAVAVFAGGWAGVAAALLSTAVVWKLWPLLLGDTPIRDAQDVVGLAVFVANGVLIALIAESMRRARAKARQAQAEAEAANRAKSEFLASMSHELRTPLNAILGFARLLCNDPHATPDQRRSFDIITRSGEHLLDLINGVLDMARVEAGRVVLEIAPFRLPELMRDVTDLLRPRAEAKGLELALELPENPPAVVQGDEGKLRQVLLNLAGNAIKFTPCGRVALRLKHRPADEPHRSRIALEVEDTGSGIAPEDQARIFEPFVQLGHQSELKGTGLGLTIARQFVGLMAGTIRVESRPGQGAKFIVDLELAHAAAEALPIAARHESRLARVAPGQPEFRMLVVDDQPENILLLRQVLEQAGFPVRVAADGAEAIAAFQAWRPQFIWMDWRMPVMDGIEATRRIRAIEGGRDVKIAAVSASVFQEERARLLAAGADDFVRKPIQFEQIYECLTRHLGVRFDFSGPAAPSPAESGDNLDPSALASLPPALRLELSEAVISLDAERIAAVVSRVAELNSALGTALGRRASQLEYTAIMRALKGAHTP
jgi:signal transduction histidine kinase/CheY-like chemotaxis protein